MTDVYDTPLFFLPITNKDEISHLFPRFSLSAPPIKKEKREYGVFCKGGMAAPYFISRAANERAIVVGCSGLNTHNLLNDVEVFKLNDAGISMIWMSLPKLHGPMMARYQYLAEQFFTNRNSPAHVLLPSDKPRYALTHSTGGQLFMHLMHQPQINKKLSHIFSGAVYVAPYFDSAGASQHHAPKINQAAFKNYFAKHADKYPQETLIGNLYMQMEAWFDGRTAHPPDRREIDVGSTCGQILELQATGQKLQDTFNAKAAAVVPSIFVIGDRDKYACSKTSHQMASAMGAEIVLAKGGYHDPLRTHPHLVDMFIGKVEDCIERHALKRTSMVPVQKITPGHIHDRADDDLFEDSLLTRLSHGAGAALQGGTRFLYTSAGLFQGLG